MNIKKVAISTIEPWAKNPKNIRTKDFERLKKQIQELGIYKPLICCRENGKYVTLGGNQRLKALQVLKHQDVEISIVEAKDDATKIKYALSDNDRAGEYDDQALAELIYAAKDKIDTDLFRIDLGNTLSVEEVLNQFGPRIEAGEEDVVPEPEKEPKSKLGELYELGPHRILCGDAMNPKNYEALMDGKLADIVFTDPPYNVGYKPGGNWGARGTKKYGPIMGDEISGEKFVEFTLDFMTRMKENTKPGGVFYICSGYASYPTFVYAIKATGMTFSCPIIWVKNKTSMGWGDYRRKHEMIIKAKRGNKKAQPILYGWNGGRHYFMDHKFEADVWEMASVWTMSLLHPTQKPLGLIQRALRNSSKPKEIVLDPFAGSGSTIVAAEREGRVTYAMDLDPIYIDVIIRRYAALGAQTEKEIRATKRQIPQEKPK